MGTLGNTVEARKLKSWNMTVPQPQNLEKKENHHNSSQAHIQSTVQFSWFCCGCGVFSHWGLEYTTQKRGSTGHNNMRISHSGSKAHPKGDTRNHAMKDPYVYVVCWGPIKGTK